MPSHSLRPPWSPAYSNAAVACAYRQKSASLPHYGKDTMADEAEIAFHEAKGYCWL